VIRGEALNVLYHPSFLSNPNSGPFMGRGGVPNEGLMTAANYNAWATSNGKPTTTTPEGQALFAQVNAIITSNRIAGTQRLPRDFLSLPVPQGFGRADPNSFDITTVQGLKLYILRNALAPSFGALSESNTSAARAVQFTVKFIF
jgi:hypothetical protein